jgi:predicted nucleic acid-binding protein
VIVVDASALLDVLLRTPETESLAQRLLDTEETLHAPHLLDIEVAQVIRRHARSGEIDDARGHNALTNLHEFPIRRYPHGALLSRVWELRHNFTAYDAVYVALAEVLDAPLVTRDRRLAVAAGHHARIELV